MVSSDKIVGVLLAAVVLGVLLGPLTAAVTDNTGEQSVTNETVTADVGSYVDLQGYSVIEDSETVYRFNSTSDAYEETTRGDDYEMDYGAGAVQALESGDIDDGDELRVSYDWEATDSTTTTVASYIPMFAILIVLVMFVDRIRREV